MFNVSVIECRKPDGKLQDVLFEEPEHAVRRYLEIYKKEGCSEFKIVDCPNHWNDFGDFVKGLNEL